MLVAKAIAYCFAALVVVLFIFLAVVTTYDRIVHWQDYAEDEIHLQYVEAVDALNGTVYKFCLNNKVPFAVYARVDVYDDCHNRTSVYLDYIESRDRACYAVQVPSNESRGNRCVTLNYQKQTAYFELYDAPSGNFLERAEAKYRPIDYPRLKEVSS